MALLILPALILMAGVLLVPVGTVLVFSVTRDGHFTLAAYGALLRSALFGRVLLNTLEISLLASGLSVLLAYPVSTHLARLPPRRRGLCLALVLLPFWTSILVKSYAFTLILGRNGVINAALTAVFGAGGTVTLLYNRAGVLIGMSNYLVPFVVFPLLANLLGQDRNLLRAAQSLGAGAARSWWRVTLPLSLPAVAAGTLLSMVISFGFFVTPALLGGRSDIMLANLVELFTRETLDWTTASAIAVLLLGLSSVLLVLLARIPGAVAGFGR